VPNIAKDHNEPQGCRSTARLPRQPPRPARWKQEMGFRQAHLEQFANLPEEIWAAHRRVAADLDD
jgi:hypothetical protein